jgi:hypothetical protein
MERDQRLRKKALSPTTELKKLIDELESKPGDYEGIAPIAWPPLEVRIPESRKPRRTLLVTKGVLYRSWAWQEILPEDSIILGRYGIPTTTTRKEISAYFSRAPVAIFVGDLDPLDLHVYLTLREDTPALRYGGLNDACLEFLQRNLKRGRRLERLMLPMGPNERRHFAILDSMVDVAALMGPWSREVFRHGLKLELEAICNLDWFKSGYFKAFRQFLERTRPTAAPAPAHRA